MIENAGGVDDESRVEIEITGESSTEAFSGQSLPIVEIIQTEITQEEKKKQTLPKKPKAKTAKQNSKLKKAPSTTEPECEVRRSSRIQTRVGQRRREVVSFTSFENLNRSLPSEDELNSSICIASISTGLTSMSITSGGSATSTMSSPPRDPMASIGSSASLSPSSLLKLKSRWRYSSDAESANSLSELGSIRSFETIDQIETRVSEQLDEMDPNPNLIMKPGYLYYDSTDLDLEERLTKFQGTDENIFRSAQRTISKECRGLLCDCYLSKEEIAKGEIGCNENCLNRLLMVECGNRCPTGERCTNRKFQRKDYCKLEIFKTEKKGHGVRTRQNLTAGGFVIEYVGEVLDPREFRRRTKDYAKENQEHFYFMALKSDTIIDATQRGNCSRFINHSCEPNCETQKWTVNGELRIGFFAIKDLEPGDEITFDYQFQRYGKVAQRCFCMTSSCRGWIGGDENDEEENEAEADVEEEEVESETTEECASVAKKHVKRRPYRRRKKPTESLELLEDMAFEEELSTLASTGLRNKNQTLTLSRLMVRAEKWDARERLLNILIHGDTPCRRLFLDYHGLRLIWGWMETLPLPKSEVGISQTITSDDHLHKLFLRTLHSLPIPNKTLLEDSKILPLVRSWSEAPEFSVKLLVHDVESSEPFSTIPDSDKQLPAVNTTPDEETVEPEPETTKHDSQQEEINSLQMEAESQQVTSIVNDLLVQHHEEITSSSNIKDDSVEGEPTQNNDRRVEKSTEDADRTEAESEDMIPKENIDVDTGLDVTAELEMDKIIWAYVSNARELLLSWALLREEFRIPKKERVQRMKQHEREADKADRHRSITDRDRSNSWDRKSKASNRVERRVGTVITAEHPRERNRDFRSNRKNRNCPNSLFLDPSLSKDEKRLLFAEFMAKKEAEEKNRRMTDEMVSLHQDRCSRLGLDSTSTPIVDPSGTYYLDPQLVSWQFIDLADPNLAHGIRVIVQAAHFPETRFPEPPTAEHTPEEELFPSWPPELPPPPPLPPAILPKYWRMNVDDQGRCYYYDIRTRVSQWMPPSPDSEPNSESEESFEEEIEEELDSQGMNGEESSSGHSPTQEPEDASIVYQKFHSWMIDRAERRKRSGLVTERIISPRSEEEKSMFVSAKLIRENKLQQLEQKLLGKYIDENVDSLGSEPPEPENATGDSQADAILIPTPLSVDPTESTEINELGSTGISMLASAQPQSPKTKVTISEEKPSTDNLEDVATPLYIPDFEVLSIDDSRDNQQPERITIPGLEETTPPSNEPESPKPTTSSMLNILSIPVHVSTPPPPNIQSSKTSISRAAKYAEEKLAKRRAHKKSRHEARKASHPAKVTGATRTSSGATSKEMREKEKLSQDRKTKAINLEKFRNQIANVIVHHLNPYRKSSCKSGHISSTEDFKHLARKMTHAIVLKEMKHSKDGKTINVNDSVKHKTKEYVKKYMARFAGNYTKSPEDSQQV